MGADLRQDSGGFADSEVNSYPGTNSSSGQYVELPAEKTPPPVPPRPKPTGMTKQARVLNKKFSPAPRSFADSEVYSFPDTNSSSGQYDELPAEKTPPPVPPRPKPPAVYVRNESSEDNHDYLEPRKAFALPQSNKAVRRPIYCIPKTDSKQKVRGEWNYEAVHGTDISFNKGDIMQLVKKQEFDDWLFVKKLLTGDEGYVPKAWVTMITSVDIESQRCFFKEMDRKKAEVKLLEPEIELGTYLLRPSEENHYVLSLRCQSESGEPEIRHYKIRVDEEGICYIVSESDSKPFGNILDLIRYYSRMTYLPCKLKEPLPPEIKLDDLFVRFSDIRINLEEKLGSGHFGSVYAGTLYGNKQVAVKSVKAGGSIAVEEFRKEAETMHKLRHPNLVSLLAICEDRGKIYIITERMSKGALLTVLRKDSGKTITFKDLMDIAIQVVEGMCYLEKMRFIHRDLRAANVLMGDGNITKIADFGLARFLDNYDETQDEDYYQETEAALPVRWTAPDAVKREKFTVKSDVWSFGILLYEMVTYGDEPYARMSNHEVFNWVAEGNRLKKPTDYPCPLALYNIMKQCWLKNSDERPKFEYIKENLMEIKTNG